MTRSPLIQQDLAAIVLGAGKGTRMGGGSLPKVLHPVAGKPMLGHIIDILEKIPISQICLVLQEDLNPFEDVLRGRPYVVCSQTMRNGTAGAAGTAAYGFSDAPVPAYVQGSYSRGEKLSASHVLVLAGDTPFLDPDVLREFILQNENRDLALCAMTPPSPKGYGRLLLDGKGSLSGIIEQKDITDPKQDELTLCHTGIFFAKTRVFFSLLKEVSNGNSQKEFYLTDLVSLAYGKGLSVGYMAAPDSGRFLGVNTKEELEAMASRMLKP
jgi:bifunctional UDP-N-acetylglucosamine pyrophosphorylase/glucosamine-1-phosphate N-acetyltransferase